MVKVVRDFRIPQEIFSGTPEQQMYGSLRLAVVAEWNQGHKKSVIESEKDLLEQVKNGASSR